MRPTNRSNGSSAFFSCKRCDRGKRGQWFLLLYYHDRAIVSDVHHMFLNKHSSTSRGPCEPPFCFLRRRTHRDGDIQEESFAILAVSILLCFSGREVEVFMYSACIVLHMSAGKQAGRQAGGLSLGRGGQALTTPHSSTSAITRRDDLGTCRSRHTSSY